MREMQQNLCCVGGFCDESLPSRIQLGDGFALGEEVLQQAFLINQLGPPALKEISQLLISTHTW
jgi:hypothetical protein